MLAEKDGFTYSARYGSTQPPLMLYWFEIPESGRLTGEELNYHRRELRDSTRMIRGAKTGTYMQIADPKETETMFDPLGEAELQSSAEILAREVRALFKDGFGSSTHFPMLHALAVRPPRYGSFRGWLLYTQRVRGEATVTQPTNHLEDLLLWAVNELKDRVADKAQADATVAGATEMLGLGKTRGLTLRKRRAQAATYFGYENGKELADSDKEIFILDCLVRTIVRAAIWSEFIPRRRA